MLERNFLLRYVLPIENNIMFNRDFNKDFKRAMNKSEIAALIASAIAGQGTNVDAGGALPKILNAILGIISVPIEVSDITALTAAQLDALNVGDAVIKKTGDDRHLYLVTYKATTGGGICLSYFDAVNVETVSYDRTESGWAYNSTDKGVIPSA